MRGGDVHQPLQRQRDDRARHAAIRRHRAGVGEHAAREAGIGAHIVRTGQFRHRHQRLDRAGGRIAGIGADIGDHLGRQRDEFRLAVESCLRGGCTDRGCGTRRSGSRGGLRSRRPSFAACARARPGRHIRATSDIFWPKPPPTSGAMTRRSLSGMPIRSAIAVRIRCGICVAQVSVTRPDSGVERGMAGAAFERRRVLPPRTHFDGDMPVGAASCAAAKPGVSTLPSTTRLRAALRVDWRRVIGERRARVDHRLRFRRSRP